MRLIGRGAAITFFIGSLVASISPRFANAAPWPMFHYDLQHTGLSPVDTSANPGTQKWAFVGLLQVLSSPAIGADGTIYVGSLYGDRLQAINPNGTPKWTSAIAVVSSSPTIGADGTIYVGSSFDRIQAINPDGTTKWFSQNLGGEGV